MYGEHTCWTLCTQMRLDVGQDGAVKASYAEVPSQTLPLPIQIRAVPLDYFDVSPRHEAQQREEC
jgi:hypothetical protein